MMLAAPGRPFTEPVNTPNPTRNRIERLLGRLKRFRRIGTRYDQRAICVLATIHLSRVSNSCRMSIQPRSLRPSVSN
ncbi:transposase [Microvirga makkahensis]|uniref:Transposase n=1 Tax=Microvirga makkahensis TaxID=1128670 RepID=A0A7X3SRC1_9HYPH|nr:transposase [Microvirga makkahensis]